MGQDYAEQRYYNNGTGRFWSPDPGGIKDGEPGNPTSWNRYSYTYGDPVNFFDPPGSHAMIVTTGTDCDLVAGEWWTCRKPASWRAWALSADLAAALMMVAAPLRGTGSAILRGAPPRRRNSRGLRRTNRQRWRRRTRSRAF